MQPYRAYAKKKCARIRVIPTRGSNIQSSNDGRINLSSERESG